MPALRHDPEQIGRGSARLRDQFVGGCEHLKRPRDVEQLHRGIGEHLDDANGAGPGGWRKTRELWHLRQSLPG